MNFLKQSKKSWLHSMHVLYASISISYWLLSLISMKPRIYVQIWKDFFLIYFQCVTDLTAIITLHSNWTICFSFSMTFFFIFLFLLTRCTRGKLFTAQLAFVSVSQSNRNDWECVCIKKFKTSIKSMKPKRNFVLSLFTLKTPTAVDILLYAFAYNIWTCSIVYARSKK